MVVCLFLVALVWFSQKKFENKMLCRFVLPHNVEIEKWVPIHSRYVVLKTKRGVERYVIDARYIVMRLYQGGVNKIFPVMVPTLEYNWTSENPIDRSTGEPSSWRTPDIAGAAWQGSQFSAFTKAISAQVAKKGLAGMLPYIIIAGVVILVGIFLYSQISGLSAQVDALTQMGKVR
jgi:hypothetical protein